MGNRSESETARSSSPSRRHLPVRRPAATQRGGCRRGPVARFTEAPPGAVQRAQVRASPAEAARGRSDLPTLRARRLEARAGLRRIGGAGGGPASRAARRAHDNLESAAPARFRTLRSKCGGQGGATARIAACTRRGRCGSPRGISRSTAARSSPYWRAGQTFATPAARGRSDRASRACPPWVDPPSTPRAGRTRPDSLGPRELADSPQRRAAPSACSSPGSVEQARRTAPPALADPRLPDGISRSRGWGIRARRDWAYRCVKIAERADAGDHRPGLRGDPARTRDGSARLGTSSSSATGECMVAGISP